MRLAGPLLWNEIHLCLCWEHHRWVCMHIHLHVTRPQFELAEANLCKCSPVTSDWHYCQQNYLVHDCNGFLACHWVPFGQEYSVWMCALLLANVDMMEWGCLVFELRSSCFWNGWYVYLVSHDELLHKLLCRAQSWMDLAGAGSAVASDVVFSHCTYCNISCSAGDQAKALKHKPVASTTLFCGTGE